MIRAAVLALCAFALPAAAFEGVLHTKMSTSAKPTEGAGAYSATGTITIKGLSSRMETESSVPGRTEKYQMVMIHRADEPNVTYMLYPTRKTYSKTDLSKEHDAASEQPEQWSVKRLGKEKIAGRTTEHVVLTKAGKNDEMELWIDKDLVSAGDLEKAFTAGQGSAGWWKTLQKQGLAGVPLKVLHREKDRPDQTVTWEVTEVKAQSVPDSVFRVPAGYTETQPGRGMMTPEQQEQMKKAMDRLTPEQKKQMEELMKGHGAGK
jgi:Domain of unknown function (DUF4412)